MQIAQNYGDVNTSSRCNIIISYDFYINVYYFSKIIKKLIKYMYLSVIFVFTTPIQWWLVVWKSHHTEYD